MLAEGLLRPYFLPNVLMPLLVWSHAECVHVITVVVRSAMVCALVKN